MRILHTAIGLTKSGGNFDDQATAESGHDHGKVDNNVLRTTDRDLSRFLYGADQVCHLQCRPKRWLSSAHVNCSLSLFCAKEAEWEFALQRGRIALIFFARDFFARHFNA